MGRTRTSSSKVPLASAWDNKIFQFASVGDVTQDKKFKGEGNAARNRRPQCDPRIRHRQPRTLQGGGVTSIGNDNLLMAYSHVGHDCRLGNHIILSNVATLGGHVEIGDFAIMADCRRRHQFTKIGAHSFIANNAAVTRDVPPYVTAVGQPAQPHSINVVGLKRRGFTDEQILNIRRAYRVLYRSGLKLKAALEQLDVAAETQAEIRPFVDFIRRISRSIVR